MTLVEPNDSEDDTVLLFVVNYALHKESSNMPFHSLFAYQIDFTEEHR